MCIPQSSNEENSVPKRRSLNRGKSVVFTSSPYKNELETKTKISEPEVKRNLFKKKRIKSITNKNKKKWVKLSISNDDDIYTECLYCGHTYAESNKGWIFVRYVRNGLIFHVLGKTMKETPHSLTKIVCNFKQFGNEKRK